MKDELRQKPVLAMYDVRGIQGYIFSTNRIKDIIGASELVENIIIDGLRVICRNNDWENEYYLIDWENDRHDAFLVNENVQMQILFIGGGNAYVLFRHGEICELVNRALAKYVLENTYSLNLAVAVVEKTENYSADYEAINLKMREVKSVMPQTKPMGAFPFMAVDSYTGYPLSVYDNSAKEYISTEARLKRKHLSRPEEAVKILDNMVTQKGDSSILAVVHMDGNSMGGRIKSIMEGKTTYSEAICAMRRISCNLKDEFAKCYQEMCLKIDCISDRVKADAKGKLYRKIIVAGDDITFICNAKVALYAVKEFMKLVSNKVMYVEEGLSESENRKKYALSACAGIAFFKSHFPFSDAYEVAEACCGNAKRVAKLAGYRADGKEDGMTGCYVDYQMCSHIKASELSAYREKNYLMPDGKLMVYRPYYVSAPVFDEVFDLNERNRERDMELILWKNLKTFIEADASRSKYKGLRNSFAFGLDEAEKEKVFLESRLVPLPGTHISTWYDALEIADICELGGEEA